MGAGGSFSSSARLSPVGPIQGRSSAFEDRVFDDRGEAPLYSPVAAFTDSSCSENVQQRPLQGAPADGGALQLGLDIVVDCNVQAICNVITLQNGSAEHVSELWRCNH